MAQPRPALRVLGVDPGLTRCGVGVVDGPPNAPSLVASELVQTAPDEPIERRLERVHARVAALVHRHRPDVVAVERVLFSRNVRTAMATGQAAGVVFLAAARADVPVVEVSPNEVKLAVAGDGSAGKAAVARLVAAQLGLDEIPRPADVADALAVALCQLAGSRIAAAADAATPAAAWDRRTAAAAAGGAAAPTTSWESHLAGRGIRVVGGTGHGTSPERRSGP